MRFKKTETAKWTIVYHKGKRIAEFVNKEFETDDKAVIRVLKDMGYQDIGRLGKAVSSIAENGSGPTVSDLLGKPVEEVKATAEPIKRSPGRPPFNPVRV